MCRVFGFKSVLESQVHNSLIHAENALETQSQKHSDGWGVAYFIYGNPHVIKSEKAAIDDRLFKKVSGIVRSKTVVAHIRNATTGNQSLLNTHPFQFGPWIFVHNGHIKKFASHKEEIIDNIDKDLSRFVLGQTDSEILFYFLLSFIKSKTSLSLQHTDFEAYQSGLQKGLESLVKIIGPLSEADSSNEGVPDEHNYLTFVLSNGSILSGYQGGQHLHFSTHKSKCPMSDSCSFYDNSCENKMSSGKVNHLVFSSEPLGGENIWQEMSIGELVSVDESMNIHFLK